MNVYIGIVGSLQSEKTLLPPNGRKLSETTKEIRRSIRLSSGKTVIDVIATKKVFVFSYNLITGPDIDIWLAFVGSGTWEIEIERRDGTFGKYSIRFSDETSQIIRSTVGGWLYENVSFTLEEI
ncbi:MAG: hypothetical protein C4589_11000 [Peptococcaceae bacterium]|nr:MAG: hypothetical protein C4589_11000 [Peptococcaceae bacterium]